VVPVVSRASSARPAAIVSGPRPTAPHRDARRDGEDSQPGRQRRVVADELEVLRHEEDEAEQRVGRPGLRRPDRRPAEDEQPDQHGALAAVPVAQTAGREHEGGEHEVVGVDDPLQVTRRRSQFDDQRRQAMLTASAARVTVNVDAQITTRTAAGDARPATDRTARGDDIRDPQASGRSTPPGTSRPTPIGYLEGPDTGLQARVFH